MHTLVQRLLCLAFSKLHAKNTGTSDLASLISSYEPNRGQSMLSVKKRVNAMLRRGHIWEEIIELCDKISGVVLVLGKGYL